jgi:aspartyl-tRNA(Asn)/glutamyl-tRNA(Gln) amidotransferase subunit C
MAEPPSSLSSKDVAHVARLARLHLDDATIESYRTQLASVLTHIARLGQVDTSGVEPMAHPMDTVNRLDPDEPGPVLTLDQVLMNAPAREGDFIAVPKVLGGDSA